MVPFNGGKMNHIFTPGKGVYEETFSCEAARRCFQDIGGTISLKVHGECCLLIKQAKSDDEFEWIFCTRYDSKDKSPPREAFAVPAGVHPAKYDNHTYCFIPLDRNKVTGKGSKTTNVGPETYSAIAAGVARGEIPDPNDPDCPNHITVEWVGRKHQGNIDGIDADHALYIHGSVVVDVPVRTREAVERMAQSIAIEGLVLYDRVTGERFKVRFDMFRGSSFSRNSKLPTAPPGATIMPRVIVPAADYAL